LTLAAENYPRQLAYQFLESIHGEFKNSHGAKVNFYSRPYQALTFEPALNRIRREYLDPRAPKNLAKLNENLTDIHNIMKKNIEEVLQRGEKLDSIGKKAGNLKDDSKKFRKQAEWARFMTEVQKYAPIAVVILIVLFVIYWKFF
jgi:vesicle transport protein SEC22